MYTAQMKTSLYSLFIIGTNLQASIKRSILDYHGEFSVNIKEKCFLHKHFITDTITKHYDTYSIKFYF